MKRKLPEGDGGLEEDGRPPAAGCPLPRQTLLKMSLLKLYGPRVGANLSLRRQVLINNVIRRIHDDLRLERGVGTLFSAAAPPVTSVHEEGSYGQAPPPPSSFILSSSLTALEACLMPASLLEDDLSMFFTLPPASGQQRAPLPRDNFSSALEEIEELCPSSSSSSSPPPTPTRLLFDVVMKEEGRSFQEAETRSEKPPPLPPSPSSSPGSFLTDFALDDALFTDIDTSMYDLGPGPPPAGAPPAKVAPVVMANDLVRFCPAGAGPQNQAFKMDLTELDHIMEVLVGS